MTLVTEELILIEGKKGQVITGLVLDEAEDSLIIAFADDTALELYDIPSCCEKLYITTDDNLEDVIGDVFVELTLKSGPTETDEYGDPHEQMFMEIQTNKQNITFTNHNEHNGYYGGFDLRCREKALGECDCCGKMKLNIQYVQHPSLGDVSACEKCRSYTPPEWRRRD